MPDNAGKVTRKFKRVFFLYARIKEVFIEIAFDFRLIMEGII